MQTLMSQARLLAPEDRHFLKKLNQQIWRDRGGERRPLTEMEFHILEECLKTNTLFCAIDIDSDGIIYLDIYQHAERKNPHQLFMRLSERHLPGHFEEIWSLALSKEAWEIFSRLSNRKTNKEFLETYGIRQKEIQPDLVC